MLDYETDTLPRPVEALAEKFPHCICDDFGCCKAQRSLTFMEMIVELSTIHPLYSRDDAEEILWSDLTNTFMEAARTGADRLEAMEKFLREAVFYARYHTF